MSRAEYFDFSISAILIIPFILSELCSPVLSVPPW